MKSRHGYSIDPDGGSWPDGSATPQPATDMHRCRICGVTLPLAGLQKHLVKCVQSNADVIDALRIPQPFEGDPELSRFAREEGSVYNRRPGMRKRAR